MGTLRGADGRFLPSRSIWDGTAWDDGYINDDGRMMVYRPDFPGYRSCAYAFRAHVVWWLRTGSIHPPGTVLHHKDEDRLNDSFENLEVMDHGKHSVLHNTKGGACLVCLNCEEPFIVPTWRTRQREVKFCSRSCFSSYPVSDETRKKRSDSVKRVHREKRK